ncbi:MAG: FtsX-like permease family protein, partial [Muribaculum sp.]|nr:FtsX-like permease family protein [Muribaculum sp.]
PWHIRLMLLGEGWVLSTIGCLIGCLIYLQYAVKEGLARANGNVGYDAYDLSWVSNMPVHFILVSLVVYLLMVIIVSIGISIPAWRISRVSPVEALRHE